TLTLPDFTRIAKRPWIAVLGVVTQFVAMPLLGLLVVTVYGLPAEIAVGVILVGCAPGGTASNVVTYLATGDTALSVSVTTLSSLLAPILTPLLTLWLVGSYMDVPFWSMVVIICQTVLGPVIVGVIIRVVASNLVDRISPVLPWLASIAIAYIVAIVVAGSAESIATAGVLVLLAVVTHNVLGLGVGYGVAAACRLDTPTRRALSFEVGLQNSGLASTLATTYFSPQAAPAATGGSRDEATPAGTTPSGKASVGPAGGFDGFAPETLETAGRRFLVRRATESDVPALVDLLRDDVLGTAREGGDGADDA